MNAPTRSTPPPLMLTGSVTGREHARVHRNNQDGVATLRDAERAVMVVTDGCSSGPRSELGAALGARWLARAALALAPTHTDPAELAAACGAQLLRQLRGLAWSLCDGPEDLGALVNDALLFTFLVAVVDHDRVVVFGQGDGAWAVNGQLVALDSGPSNAPDYIAYALLSPTRSAVQVHHVGPTDGLSSVLLATDGLLDAPELLPALLEDPALARNPFTLQRRLVVAGVNQGRLGDDTSLAIWLRAGAPCS